MKHVVVAVYDESAQTFGHAHFFVSKGAAIRSFADEVNRDSPDNLLCRHFSDFKMFYLGEYDDSSARFSLLDVPERIADGVNMKMKKD